MNRSLVNSTLSVLLIITVSFVYAVEPEENGEQKTQVVAAISQKVFKKMTEAQELIEEKKYEQGLIVMDSIRAKGDDLSNYEKAQMWNIYAYTYYLQEHYKESIDAYENLIALPDVPEGLITSSLNTLSQLYFTIEDYQRTIDTAPGDLRKMNRATLAAMGVNKDVADIFIANGIYTPREQTLLVAAIDSMKNTSGREEYIKFATLTDNPDIAFFRQRQAQMYAAYNSKVKPLDSFIAIGEISAGKTKDGNIVFNVPLDHLLWTKGIAAVISVINQRVTLMEGINEKHLLVSGTISQQSRKALQKMGWKVKENADSILF